ncbi:glycoside hydrolase [Treponema brennaborense]|uniref:Glycoside hydrolase family 38 n=1 Tax=Treponema brennaborense (strain DSM 12168 / CIP 105900 / DD5/3) TaxID=906968 RepID=F4LP38_TREBD|nr:glycoside hydrolase [Treponema brennaborense]AEE15914.1 glycoside hydrolase family 38 [Treponema brennaborense DSM 12168]
MVKNIYLVHHSHTDIGYTDYQEKIVFNHVAFIRDLPNTVNDDFKWNCETLFCVERFLKEADENEKKEFFRLVKEDKIGLSATYLNFTDLADVPHLTARVRRILSELAENGVTVRTAMFCDINGISLGSLDSYLDSGIEFLFTNVHCHHGMYPLFRNQQPFFWKSMKSGRSLLVWNGEHYNLGNALGFTCTKRANFMTENYFGSRHFDDAVKNCTANVKRYIAELEESGYDKDFLISAVSGVFSDNAPPNPEIAAIAKGVETELGTGFSVKMVTLAQLYSLIQDDCRNAPVYTGDFTDWWSFGVGSNPYATKHYLEAVRTQRKAELFGAEGVLSPALNDAYVDNALLYAEHTFGHSATVTDPSETMVQNLEFRKSSYASRANEAANMNLLRVYGSLHDSCTYYDRDGRIRVLHKGNGGLVPISFYIECWPYELFEVVDERTGRKMETQVSKHPRGALVSFYDTFAHGEEKRYRYAEIPLPAVQINTRHAYCGSERVRDIVNEYDPVTYTLPYQIDSPYFRITFSVGGGITGVYDRVHDRELLSDGDYALFNPVYEVTEGETDLYEQRRLLGRNIRGLRSKRYTAVVTGVTEVERGAVFNKTVLSMELYGLKKLDMVLKLYTNIPKIEVTLKVYKNLCLDAESLFLPLTLRQMKSLYFNKGGAYFRPGVEQIPGSCMEYYLLTDGLVYEAADTKYAIGLPDAPLVYTGEMKHHPVRLCRNLPEDNLRPLYSWIMNNNWETNFPLSLAGITEFRYTLTQCDAALPDVFAYLNTDSLETAVIMEKNQRG